MGVFGGERIDTLWAMAGMPQVPNDNDRKRLNGRSCMDGNLGKSLVQRLYAIDIMQLHIVDLDTIFCIS